MALAAHGAPALAAEPLPATPASVGAAASLADRTLVDRSLVETGLEVQRAIFQTTLQEVQRGTRTNIDTARASLARYPLLPYLEYALLQRNLARLPAADVAQFVERYRDAPLAQNLRRQWLRNAARQRDWPGFLSLYDEAIADDGLRCAAAEARYRGGDAGALQAVPALWRRGVELPPACTAIVAAWTAAGGIDDALALQRIDAALAAGRVTLARATLRQLSDAARASATDLIEVHEAPTKLLALPPQADTPRGRVLLAHGVVRLARTNAAAAERFWQDVRGRYAFDTEARREVLVALVRGAMEQGIARAAEPIPETQDGSHTAVVERAIRDGVAAGRWPWLAVELGAVPGYRKPEPRWRYWLARALELSGPAANATASAPAPTAGARGPRAQELYAGLAKERNYYGFLAADRLQQRPTLTPRLLTPDATQVAALQRSPGLRRTFELLALGRNADARVEWKFLVSRLTPEQALAAGTVAARAGLYRLAIQTVIDRGVWDALELRFPTAYADLMFPAAAERGIDPSWVYAIARQESQFASDARSPVGALGLMQLMPGTGAMAARQAGVALNGDRALLEPAVNVRLGTQYLAQMYESFGYHRALASAGYNAGPGRVREWLRSRPASPVDVWIESIPFSETRNYVQNVLLYSHIYSRLLGTHQPFLFDHER